MIRRAFVTALALSITGLAIPSASAVGQVAGELDPSFGQGGVAQIAIGPSSFPSDIALRPDGKILIAGTTVVAGFDMDLALTRLNLDGSVDETFGFQGTVTTAIGPDWEQTGAMVIQPDGKIVLVGGTTDGVQSDVAIVRYNENGSLDTSFDGDSGAGNGVVITAVGSGGDMANAVALQPDGKILIAGYTTNAGNGDYLVARYNTDGTLDTSFNSVGHVSVAIGTGNDNAIQIALQPDGKIIAAGVSYINGRFELSAARFTATGQLDTSFSGDGKFTTDVSSTENYGLALALQSDGKILIAGGGNVGNGGVQWTNILVRLRTDGTLDPTFGVAGKVATSVAVGTQFADTMMVQSDGKIVVAGRGLLNNDLEFMVSRYQPDGSLDVEFNGDGVAAVRIGSTTTNSPQGLAIDGQGRYVVAGTLNTGFSSSIGVARYFGQTVAPATPAPLAGAPASVRYTAGNKSVTVRWSEVANASSYEVATTGGTVRCTTSATSCTIGGLRNGASYTFVVRALNADGVRSTTATRVTARPGFQVKTTSVKAGRTVRLTSIVTTPSIGTRTFKVTSGRCRIQRDRLVAPSTRGTCKIRVTVAKRGSFAAMSTTITVTITR